MPKSGLIHFKTITELHRSCGLPGPEHPSISVVDYATINIRALPAGIIFDGYSIAVKRGTAGIRMMYGQQQYDFDAGVMLFTAPNQVIRIEATQNSDVAHSGWILFIHPDFLWNTSLAKTIKRYEYFGYSVNEALFLSNKEENIINTIIQNIQQEYHSNIDNFSQGIVIAHLETLLSYAERFYHRQFITRKKANHQVLDRLEELLNDYLNDDVITKGLPTVQYLSGKLNISVSYLSRMLKVLTGQTTQQHIHEKLIEKAKEKLSTTDLSVSEIAYQLGFEHSQTFSRLFKSKTNQSPLEFRASFN
ncbi:helix-turn-helix domain-containing protein [Chitinophaga tropicalis]|uniref:Helix-turn-helix domain-containing protein n=1 Tax=Chitinophaga tropicalis TaxID=2683588 RepID=A0A7K1U7K6_9BACT|nr:helix-turn-helix transcriptional regulator [Chitinophaga tropicalis]MVT10334.1 helix-turn-helix domain-containing protein [Chitinophaga tropicalis]